MLRLALCMLVAATATARADGPRALPPIPKTGPVTVIQIDKVVDLGLAPFIDRITSAGEPGDLLVLDINTLGGRIDAAIMIRDALLHTEARTVCWVHPRAISAGALIALACDVIAVAPGATLGAATPVQIGPSGEMTPVEAKVVSFMRSEMRATALAKGGSDGAGHTHPGHKTGPHSQARPRIQAQAQDSGHQALIGDGVQVLSRGCRAAPSAARPTSARAPRSVRRRAGIGRRRSATARHRTPR